MLIHDTSPRHATFSYCDGPVSAMIANPGIKLMEMKAARDSGEEIVKRHGGELRIASREGGGEVTVDLPAV